MIFSQNRLRKPDYVGSIVSFKPGIPDSQKAIDLIGYIAIAELLHSACWLKTAVNQDSKETTPSMEMLSWPTPRRALKELTGLTYIESFFSTVINRPIVKLMTASSDDWHNEKCLRVDRQVVPLCCW